MTDSLSSIPSDCDRLREFAQVARQRQLPTVFLNMTCDLEVNARRLQSQERLSGPKTKLTDPSILRSLIRENQLLAASNCPREQLAGVDLMFVKVDVTHRSVSETVELLMNVLQNRAQVPI